MSFLITVSSFLKKQINHIHTPEKKAKTCEEYPDLYEDDDFLEISRMSSEELRSEIYSYDEDPDEILALIQGRLDNKVISIKKSDEIPNSINLTSLLSNVIDKKIYLDAFSNQQKRNSLTVPFYSVLVVSAITFLFIPPITEVSNTESTKDETTRLAKNTDIKKTIALVEANNRSLKLEKEYSALKEEHRKLNDKYIAVLAENEAQKTYAIKQKLEEDALQKNNFYSSSSIASSLTEAMTNFNLKDNFIEDENVSNLAITMLSQDENKILLDFQKDTSVNYDNLTPLNKPSASINSSNIDDINVKLKVGDNLSAVTRAYGLSLDKWGGFEELSFVEEGDGFIIKSDGNYVEKISLVEKDGFVVNYRVEGDTIVSTSSSLYYIDDLLIEGKVVTSLSEAIKNNKLFKNNLQIARIITQKAEHDLSTEPAFNFKKIASGASFKIVAKVRKNKNTDEIMSVEDVKVNKLDKFNVASNTSL